MFCKGFTIPNFNLKKDNFFVMLKIIKMLSKIHLFQNLTSGFGEKSFLRISSCPCAESPHSPEPCLWRDQNFANNFEKGHPRNIPVKLFKNLTSSFGEEDSLRISSCPYSARSPHSPEPCLWTDQNFANNF